MEVISRFAFFSVAGSQAVGSQFTGTYFYVPYRVGGGRCVRRIPTFNTTDFKSIDFVYIHFQRLRES